MKIASPCNAVCRLDDATGWCIGCGRTMAEISGWSGATRTEKAEILTRLPDRMRRLGSSRGERGRRSVS